jgi:hypothetical protein
MMLNGGSLDGVQIISPKTVAMFSVNYLPDGRDMVDMTTWSFGAPEGYAGVGYSLACAVNANLAKTRLPGSQGEFFWSGAASTYFWIDPVEDLAVVFMTQVMGPPKPVAMRRGGGPRVFWGVAQYHSRRRARARLCRGMANQALLSPAPHPEPNQHRTFLAVDHSLSGRHWIERLDAVGANMALAIAQRHHVHDIVARVLAGRDVGVEDAPRFLAPALRDLTPDPSRLTDMDKAAARIASAVTISEKVAIFGDYDVDGATSSALLARFLRHQGLDPIIYIPDRLFEGYGPNVEAVRKLAAEGTRLIVTVDCG